MDKDHEEISYELISGLTIEDENLIPTDSDYIWIGLNDSGHPMDRSIARRYRRCDIFIYNDRRVFRLNGTPKDSFVRWYYVPEEELGYITNYRT